ncbi:MAG: hypothetical protein GY830_11385, partial [Bacteroidetes bacterium]|nr:hypothetical protein [Bacteroidota bacterium]
MNRYIIKKKKRNLYTKVIAHILLYSFILTNCAGPRQGAHNMKRFNFIRNNRKKTAETFLQSKSIYTLSNETLASCLYKNDIELFESLLEKWPYPDEYRDINNNTLLQIASLMGKPRAVTLLLKAGANVKDNKNKKGFTALCYATENKKHEVIRRFRGNKKAFNALNKKGLDPLSIAYFNDDYDTLCLLLEMGADPNNWRNKVNKTLLKDACENHRQKYVTKLLAYKAKANIKEKAKKGISALQHVVKEGDMQILKEINYYENESIFNEKDKQNRHLMKIAYDNEQYDILKYLLNKKSRYSNDNIFDKIRNYNRYDNHPDCWKDNSGSSLLQYACKDEKEDYIKLLVSYNANVNIKNPKLNPLFITYEKELLDIFELLLKFNADPDLWKNHFNSTLLHKTCTFNHFEFFKLLTQYDANPNFKNYLSVTPLHTSIQYGHLNLIEHFHKNVEKADFTVLDGEKRNPLMIAYDNNKYDIFEYLLRNRIDGNKPHDWKDSKNNNILQYVCSNDNREYLDLLIKYGANLNHEENKNLLNIAYTQDNFNLFQYLLKNQLNPDLYRGKQNITIFQNACFNNKEEYVRELIKYNLNANIKENQYGLTPIQIITKLGHENLLQSIINNPKVDTTLKDNFFRNLLKIAYDNNQYDSFKYILENNTPGNLADDWKDFSGATLLSYVSEQNKIEYTNLLLQNGANPNYRNLANPLMIAYVNDNKEIFDLLLNYNANPDLGKTKDDLTLLYHACINNQNDYAKKLLLKNANINIEKNGLTPLHQVVANGNIDLLEFILKNIHSADFMKLDNQNRNLLKIAYDYDQIEMFEFILKNNIRFNRADSWIDRNRTTLLSYACKTNKHKYVKLLLKYGANPNIDNLNTNPLCIAFSNDNFDIFNTLLANGAKPDLIKIREGQTLLNLICNLKKADHNEKQNKNYNNLSNNKNPDFNPFPKNKYAISLINYDANPNIKSEEKISQNALHKIVTNGNLELLEYVYKKSKSTDFYDLDSKGRNLLKIAYDNRQLKTFKYLVQNKLYKNKIDTWEDFQGSTLLHYACKDAETEYIKILLEEGSNPNKKNNQKKRYSSVDCAIDSKKPEFILYLMKQYSKYEIRNLNGIYNISRLYDRSNYTKIKQILSYDSIDVNKLYYKNGNTFLQQALKDKDEKAIKIFLNYGSDPFLRNKEGLTAFHFAMSLDDPKIIRNLEKKCKPKKNNTYASLINKNDNNPISILDLAMKANSINNLEYLIDKLNLNPDDYINEDQQTLLLQAADKNKTELFKMLLNKGSDSLKRDKYGNNIFHYIAKNGNTEFIDIIESEANQTTNIFDFITAFGNKETININSRIKRKNKQLNQLLYQIKYFEGSRNKNNKTPIEISYKNKNYKIFKILLSKLKYPNECLNTKDEENKRNNLLQLAIKDKESKILKILLENKKIDPNIIDNTKKKETALHYTVKNRDLRTLKVILRNPHIKYDLKNDFGLTPLDISLVLDYLEISKMLLPKTNINKISNQTKEDIFRNSYRKQNFKLLKFLIESNYLPSNWQKSFGEKLFKISYKKKEIKGIKFLIDHGVDPDSWTDKKGRTLLKIAYDEEDRNQIRFLLEAGADANKTKDNDGNTIIHQICKKNQNDFIELFNKYSKNQIFNKKNNNNKTPINILFEKNKLETISKINKKERIKKEQSWFEYGKTFFYTENEIEKQNQENIQILLDQINPEKDENEGIFDFFKTKEKIENEKIEKLNQLQEYASRNDIINLLPTEALQNHNDQYIKNVIKLILQNALNSDEIDLPNHLIKDLKKQLQNEELRDDILKIFRIYYKDKLIDFEFIQVLEKIALTTSNQSEKDNLTIIISNQLKNAKDEKEDYYTKDSFKIVENLIFNHDNIENFYNALKIISEIITNDSYDYKLSQNFINDFIDILFRKKYFNDKDNLKRNLKEKLKILNTEKEKFEIINSLLKLKKIYPQIIKDENPKEWMTESLIFEISKNEILNDLTPYVSTYHKHIKELKKLYPKELLHKILLILNNKKTNQNRSLLEIAKIISYLNPKTFEGLSILFNSQETPFEDLLKKLKSNCIINLLKQEQKYNAAQLNSLENLLNQLDWDLLLLKEFLKKTKKNNFHQIIEFLNFLIVNKVKKLTTQDLIFKNKFNTNKIDNNEKHENNNEDIIQENDYIKKWFNEIETYFIADYIDKLKLKEPKEWKAKVISIYKKGCSFEKIKQLLNKIENENYVENIDELFEKVINKIYEYGLPQKPTEEIINILLEEPIYRWKRLIHKNIIKRTFIESKKRTLSELTHLILKETEGVKYVENEKELENEYDQVIDAYNSKSEIIRNYKNISEWTKDDITKWAIKARGKLEETLDFIVDEKRDETDERKKFQKLAKSVLGDKEKKKIKIIKPSQKEMIAVIKRAVELFTKDIDKEKGIGYSPREIQILSVLTLLNPAKCKGRLAQINTGEGKSLIVAMLAAIKVLQGNKVDVITTSSELSGPEVEEMMPFFRFLNISVSENSKAESNQEDDKKNIYSKDIVYGSTSTFQGDILHDEYQCKGIRNKRPFSVAIIDEVDSMFIDGKSSRVQLTSPKPAMNYLAIVLGYIWNNNLFLWSKIIKDKKTGKFYFKPNRKNDDDNIIDKDCIEIPKQNRWDYVKSLTKITGLTLLRDLTDEEKEEYKEFIELEKKHKENKDKLDKEFKNKKNKSKQDLKDENALKKEFMEKCQEEEAKTRWRKNNRPAFLNIPIHLKQFARSQLESWADNALKAKFCFLKGKDYDVIKGKVVPIDYNNTGKFNDNMVWSEGLTQFIEIKENLKISAESLSPSFISNLELFKRYKFICGCTGTIGTEADKNILKENYNVDTVTIPSFKEIKIAGKENSKYICKELPAIVKSKREDWEEAIINSTIDKLKNNRAALIICESVREAEAIANLLRKKGITKVFEYTGKGNFTKKEIEEGEVIVATNISGRGTDFKTNDIIEANGGMHVCVTFLPHNLRVELQNIGRTARKGQKGTGQLIIFDENGRTIEEIKEERDKKSEENTKKAKKIFDEMAMRDKLFKKACDLRNYIFKNNIKCQEAKALEERWAMWLNQNVDSIKDEDIDEKEIGQKYDIFKEEIINSLKKEYKILQEWFNNTQEYYGRIVQNPHFFVIKGNELFFANSGNSLSRAIRYFKQAIAIDKPFSLHAHYNMAFTYLKRDGEDKTDGGRRCARGHLKEAKKLLNDNYYKSVNALNGFIGAKDEKLLIAKQVQHQMDILGQYENSIDQAISQLDRIIDNENHATISRQYFDDIFKDSEENYDDELRMFNSNGLECFFTVTEKKPTPWNAILTLICSAVIQIAAGVIILACSGNVRLAKTFIREGINDIFAAINAYRTGEFDWKSWATQKATAYTVTILTMGLAQAKKSLKILEKVKKFLPDKDTSSVMSIVGDSILSGVKGGLDIVAQETYLKDKCLELEGYYYDKIKNQLINALKKNPLVNEAFTKDKQNNNNYWQETIINEGKKSLDSEEISYILQYLAGVGKGVLSNIKNNYISSFESKTLNGLNSLADLGADAYKAYNVHKETEKFGDKFINDFSKLIKKHEKNIKELEKIEEIKKEKTLINKYRQSNCNEEKEEVENKVAQCIKHSSVEKVAESLASTISKRLANKYTQGFHSRLINSAGSFCIDNIYQLSKEAINKKQKQEQNQKQEQEAVVVAGGASDEKINERKKELQTGSKIKIPENPKIKKATENIKNQKSDDYLDLQIASMNLQTPIFLRDKKGNLFDIVGYGNEGNPISMSYHGLNNDKQGVWGIGSNENCGTLNESLANHNSITKNEQINQQVQGTIKNQDLYIKNLELKELLKSKNNFSFDQKFKHIINGDEFGLNINDNTLDKYSYLLPYYIDHKLTNHNNLSFPIYPLSLNGDNQEIKNVNNSNKKTDSKRKKLNKKDYKIKTKKCENGTLRKIRKWKKGKRPEHIKLSEGCTCSKCNPTKSTDCNFHSGYTSNIFIESTKFSNDNPTGNDEKRNEYNNNAVNEYLQDPLLSQLIENNKFNEDLLRLKLLENNLNE